MSTFFESFIVLESIEEKPITKLSPFAIERFLLTNVAPRSVETTCNNTLTVEVTKKKCADLLLKTIPLHNMKIKIDPRRSLNTCRGVVRGSELSSCSIKEIKHVLSQLVSEVKRITIRKKNDQPINTNTDILSFNALKPSPHLKIGYMIAKVDTYISNLLHCFNCQKFRPHKVDAQEREYVKNVETMVLTTQNPPANDLNMLTVMDITQPTLSSVQHGKEKNFKNTIHSRYPFSRGKKNCRNPLPSYVLLKSNTAHTKPFHPSVIY